MDSNQKNEESDVLENSSTNFQQEPTENLSDFFTDNQTPYQTIQDDDFDDDFDELEENHEPGRKKHKLKKRKPFKEELPKSKQQEVRDYVDTTMRLQADFENFRRNAAMQIAEAKSTGLMEAAAQFVPVLDSLSAAKKMINDPQILEGFLMVENQILGAFKALGVEKIPALHQQFNPKFHNALAVQNIANIADGIIVEEYQAGYKLNEKIIRYSQVIVNKKED